MPIFQHRIELVPGIEDVGGVIKDIIKKPMDTLAKTALRAGR